MRLFFRLRWHFDAKKALMVAKLVKKSTKMNIIERNLLPMIFLCVFVPANPRYSHKSEWPQGVWHGALV